MLDAAQMRRTMVESQVQTNDVTDRRLLKAMLELPREAFVPTERRAVAYMDAPVPVLQDASGRTLRAIPEPLVTAKLVHLADVSEREVVLEIGTATGYGAALLARLASSVIALESETALAERARRTLAELDVGNVAVVTGPLAEGFASEGPYDAIVISGTIPEVPQALRDQLKQHGRLVALVGERAPFEAQIWQRHGQGWSARTAFEAGAPPLPGFARPKGFVF